MSVALGELGDADLVLLAQAGAADAFGVLYDRHAPGVGRALASFAGPDHDLLDDLVQDVFLRVATTLPGYAPSRPFTHWLYTVALNVGRNHARRHPMVTVPPADLVRLAGADDSIADAEESAFLMHLLARLPISLREVVSLRVGADLAYGDIAELLDIPAGTARRRMHDALWRLRELMDSLSQPRSDGHD